MAWNTLQAVAVNVLVAQAGSWDRIGSQSVGIAVAPSAGWDRIGSQSIVVSPAITPPSVGWDKIGSKSITIQPATPPSAQYTLTLAVLPTGGGTASKSPDKATYNSGDVVVLTASPASGYLFDYWDADSKWLDNKNPLSFTVRASQKITAHFRQRGMPPTPPPKPTGEGVSTGLILGGVALAGLAVVAIGASKKRRP